VVANVLFFSSILVFALWIQFQYPPTLYEGEPMEAPEIFLGGSLPIMVVNVFLFNLVVSAFIFVTLSGLLFFAFPVVVLMWRAALWGGLLNLLPTPLFLASLPRLVLEGEGYVLASVAGMTLGLSWLKPDWVYRSEGLSRQEALRMSLKESVYLYVLVVVFLLVAAVVESITIALTAGV